MSHVLSFTRRTAAWLSAAAGALTLTGCVIAPVDDGHYHGNAPYYTSDPSMDGYYNGTYYPAIPYEVVPVAPYAGAIWVHGAWTVDNGRRYWRPGRYERPNGNRPNGSHFNTDRPNSGHRPNWNRPDGDRPNGSRPILTRPDQRPNRPDGNARPDSRPGNNSRPPSHHFAPPTSGNANTPSTGILRPIAPVPSGTLAPSRPSISSSPMHNLRPSGQLSERPFLNRKDPNGGS